MNVISPDRQTDRQTDRQHGSVYLSCQYKQCNFLGSLYGRGAGFAGAVWDKNYISPTLTTMQGGNREPLIVIKV